MKILNKIKNKALFARGKRGVVSVAFLNGKKVAMKEKRFGSKAENTTEKEVEWLKILNGHSIGPKFIAYENGILIYEFVDGEYLPKFLENAAKEKIIKVLKNILEQCRKLDKLGINKLEMTRPRKHVIVTKAGKNLKPIMIDFERCRKTEKPKNVTQFCQFITLNETSRILREKNICIDKDEMISLAKNYKKNPDEKSFKKIKDLLD